MQEAGIIRAVACGTGGNCAAAQEAEKAPEAGHEADKSQMENQADKQNQEVLDKHSVPAVTRKQSRGRETGETAQQEPCKGSGTKTVALKQGRQINGERKDDRMEQIKVWTKQHENVLKELNETSYSCCPEQPCIQWEPRAWLTGRTGFSISPSRRAPPAEAPPGQRSASYWPRRFWPPPRFPGVRY